MLSSPYRALSTFVLVTGLLFADAPSPVMAARGGQLKLNVVEKETGKPLAARIHLKNAAGRAPKVPKVPTWADHFVFDGSITLKLPNGNYMFELECGPEYLDQQGHFQIMDFADDEKTLEMRRFVNMAEEGWYSGDLDVRRPVKDLELLMRADDLHVAEVLTAGAKLEGVTLFDGNRCYVAGNAEPILHAVARPTQWDLPLLVAEGAVDVIELANLQLHRSGLSTDEQGCKPRDKTFFPGPEGVARWGEKVYYHLLNCGLRIAPAAGSGSGEAPNPVGYNRVYVHLDGEFSYDAWLAGLKAGCSVITNGPMIRPTVEGEYPGHVFQADAGQEVELEVGVNLATREKIAYLEIVQNGIVAHQVRLDDFKKAGGRLPKVIFKESGWFLLRVVTNNQKTYRLATTAPYYVEIGYQRRVSKESAEFFADWVKERMQQVSDKADTKRWEQAVGYWQAIAEKANAE